MWNTIVLNGNLTGPIPAPLNCFILLSNVNITRKFVDKHIYLPIYLCGLCRIPKYVSSVVLLHYTTSGCGSPPDGFISTEIVEESDL